MATVDIDIKNQEVEKKLKEMGISYKLANPKIGQFVIHIGKKPLVYYAHKGTITGYEERGLGALLKIIESLQDFKVASKVHTPTTVAEWVQYPEKSPQSEGLYLITIKEPYCQGVNVENLYMVYFAWFDGESFFQCSERDDYDIDTIIAWATLPNPHIR